MGLALVKSDVVPAPEPAPIVVLHLGCNHLQTVESLGLEMQNPDGSLVTRPVRLVNLDMNPDVKPDLVCCLGRDDIHMTDETVDYVIANQILEHIGRQGELHDWFYFWQELYRVMKPGANLRFVCPYYTSVWAWSDPTHTRAISEQTFLYLDQNAYRCGGAIPDYRPRFDFVTTKFELLPDAGNADIAAHEKVSFISGTLMARKPLKPYWLDAGRT
jgi:hypothetical protein